MVGDELEKGTYWGGKGFWEGRYGRTRNIVVEGRIA